MVSPGRDVFLRGRATGRPDLIVTYRVTWERDSTL